MRTFQKAKVGDTVLVEYTTIEEGTERRQTFEGILISVRGSAINQAIAVRRISFGVGVERTFPTQSPRFVGLKVIREGRVRRAKLYYLRNLTGKTHRVAAAKSGGQTSTATAATTGPPQAQPAQAAPAESAKT